MSKMNKESNAYIFGYSSLLVLIVAVTLTLANQFLKPFQERNIRIEKMTNILAAVGIDSDAKTAEKLFDEYIKREIAINSKGDIIGVYENGKQVSGDIRAFDLNLKAELKKQKKTGDGIFPLFIAEKDGKKIYIVPVYGKGLWAPIWGNLAFKDDFNTVVGANFGHESETPGLGAEIAQKKTPGKVVFADQFTGKTIFDKDGNFVSIKCVKGGVDNQTKVAPEHGVDAISGGTLTSNGVTDMIYDCLINYVEYIKKIK
jgi:Na+-transporting NADH:ubiquinone oxidoreductase subunit C